MNKRSGRISTVSIVCFAIIIGAVSIYNICTNDSFFELSVSATLNLAIIIFISYYLTQMRNDKRKQQESIERLIVKIQSEVIRPGLFNGDCEYKIKLLHQRSITNKIEYIKKLGLAKIATDISYIDTEYNTLRDLYSNHMNNSEDINKLRPDFEKHIMNIADRCDMILIEITK